MLEKIVNKSKIFSKHGKHKGYHLIPILQMKDKIAKMKPKMCNSIKELFRKD